MQKVIKTIIVDDEKLAREDIKAILAKFEDIIILGEAGNFETAVKLIDEQKPDVVFLDIQMPGKNGFEILKEIKISCDVVFVTAYDDFAVNAFETEALDYLLKPVSEERIIKTIERIRNKKILMGTDTSEKDQSIFITINKNYHLVKFSSIVKINSAGNYTEIFLDNKIKGLVYKTMKQWQELLPSETFLRIHRNTIINVNYIKEFLKGDDGIKIVLSKTEKTEKISRRNFSLFRDNFSLKCFD